MSGRRSKDGTPWHYDALFGIKTKMNNLDWQRGLLIADKDRDTMIIGEREAMIARILSEDSTELQPDSKLLEPTSSDEDDINFTL